MIEILVAMAMMAILFSLLMVILNPGLQINKARDARRQHDLLQIKNALDTYYNDYNCYPQTLSALANGYMQKIPKDPDTGLDYYYEMDGSCPQWNVLFAGLSKPASTQSTCPLLPDCVPTDFSNSYACVLSGEVDCEYISTNGLPALPTPTLTPTPTVTPIPTPTTSPPSQPTSTLTPTLTLTPTPSPSPTPISCLQSEKNWSCTGFPLHCGLVPSGTGQYCTSDCNSECE